jgi:GH15 family glucan-1,4-alpha-glucosidase
MPRDLPLGNGKVLVAFDGDYRLRELCYPHVGCENHVRGALCRFGVFVDGAFTWIERARGWDLAMRYQPDTLGTDVQCRHTGMGLLLSCSDCVDFHENLYLRHVVVHNQRSVARQVRLFFHQNLAISESDVGDTAVYDPVSRAVVHYKGPRYFLVNLRVDGRDGVEHWAIGQKNLPGKEGTFRDAEDGELGHGLVAQGAVDSVVAAHCDLGPDATAEIDYWIAMGPKWTGSWDAVRELNAKVVERGPQSFLARTRDYWKLWGKRDGVRSAGLPEGVADLCRRSLLILRTHIDQDGAVIAAVDSDILSFSRDTYSYCWPRDGALAARALDLAGFQQAPLRFYHFCADRLTSDGYLLHKYTADGQLGSSWHPWMGPHAGGKGCDGISACSAGAGEAPAGYEMQLPIQEDETALVVWALWHHFQRWQDVEAIRGLYGRLVKKSARFLARYRDPVTRLPGPSYDLWEERRGICTFTCGAVVAGLDAAAEFARAFGEDELGAEYAAAASEIRQAMARHLYRPELGRFARMITVNGAGDISVDATLDASLAGAFMFGAFAADDPRVVATMKAVRDELTCRTPVGGVARYRDDYYHQVSRDLDKVPGNPWVLCTVWTGMHAVACAKSLSELEPARDVLRWAEGHKLPSGVLAEQLDPLTGAPLSVAPLAWSHAALVTLVEEYQRKVDELR